MKPLSVILLSVVLSAGAAGLVVTVLSPTSELEVRGGESAGARSSEVDDLRREIASQREVLSQLAQRLEQKSEMSASSPSARIPVGEDVEAVVRRVLDEQTMAKTATASKAEGGSASPFSIEGAAAEIAALFGNAGGYEGVESYWQKLRKQGVATTDMLSAFESFAAAHPNDPEAQVMLGNAYIQRLNEAKTGPEMGQWAMKADGAYDGALALDDTNWNARFSKAISLSFWPPIFGKQGEAIRQFEVLLDQQREAPAQARHAETYLLLGNLYQQQGDLDKAQALWQEGRDLFPDDEDLSEKLSGK